MAKRERGGGGEVWRVCLKRDENLEGERKRGREGDLSIFVRNGRLEIICIYPVLRR